jgi:pimeloyl-ACP methyl ester carboxylesterase
MNEPALSTISVRGCRIRLFRGGSGAPLLVLHGASGGGWQPFMAKLSQQFDVIAPEHPGFGESDMPDWLDTIHDLAYYYLDFLEQLDLERVHLVGISLGGWIAAELAVRNTARLASLTLVGAAGLYVEGVAQIDPFLRTEEQRIRDFFHDQSRADEMIARVLKPELEDIALRNRTIVARLTWQPRSHDPHLHKWLHRIDVPTLVIWGDHDRLFPREHAIAYGQSIAGAKTVIVPECGHVPHSEKPDAFVAELAAFIDGLKTPPEGRRAGIAA